MFSGCAFSVPCSFCLSCRRFSLRHEGHLGGAFLLAVALLFQSQIPNFKSLSGDFSTPTASQTHPTPSQRQRRGGAPEKSNLNSRLNCSSGSAVNSGCKAKKGGPPVTCDGQLFRSGLWEVLPSTRQTHPFVGIAKHPSTIYGSVHLPVPRR